LHEPTQPQRLWGTGEVDGYAKKSIHFSGQSKLAQVFGLEAILPDLLKGEINVGNERFMKGRDFRFRTHLTRVGTGNGGEEKYWKKMIGKRPDIH
jgi:hypothetical protein